MVWKNLFVQSKYKVAATVFLAILCSICADAGQFNYTIWITFGIICIVGMAPGLLLLLSFCVCVIPYEACCRRCMGECFFADITSKINDNYGRWMTKCFAELSVTGVIVLNLVYIIVNPSVYFISSPTTAQKVLQIMIYTYLLAYITFVVANIICSRKFNQLN